MRRKEQEITDKAAIEAIIHRASVCRLGMSKGDEPYVVPLCFGYEDNALYFHSAREGKKIDILRENSRVCFELDVDPEIKESNRACKWGIRYLSVIGYGKASLIEDQELKQKMLSVIMAHYSNRSFSFEEGAVKKALVIRVDIESMTGKRSGSS